MDGPTGLKRTTTSIGQPNSNYLLDVSSRMRVSPAIHNAENPIPTANGTQKPSIYLGIPTLAGALNQQAAVHDQPAESGYCKLESRHSPKADRSEQTNARNCQQSRAAE